MIDQFWIEQGLAAEHSVALSTASPVYPTFADAAVAR